MAEGVLRELPADNVVRTAYDQNGNTARVWRDAKGVLHQDRPGLGTYTYWRDDP